jgi:hypothetical protein
MKKKTKSKIIEKKVPLTKSLGDLMKDEDGYVSKETILKVGLSTVAALGITGVWTDVSNSGATYSSNASHTNVVFDQSTGTAANCIAHTNVSTHTSY